jgi:hypothetical protein
MRFQILPRVLTTRGWLTSSALSAGLALVPAPTAFGQGWEYVYDACGNWVIQALDSAVARVIIGQPQRQVVAPGELASFAIVLADTSGVSYQLQFNSTNIPGSTGDALLLVNAAITNQGPYSVVVANSSGSVTSAPAALMIDLLGGGMPDSLQLACFGNLNQDPLGDFDGEGVSNLDEFREGTNPTNSASFNPRLHLRATPCALPGTVHSKP